MSYPPAGLSDSPIPRWSTAMTSKSRASAGISRRQAYQVSGQPCTSSSGGPSRRLARPMTACRRSSPVLMYRLVNVSVNPAGRFGAPETETGPSGVDSGAEDELMRISRTASPPRGPTNSTPTCSSSSSPVRSASPCRPKARRRSRIEGTTRSVVIDGAAERASRRTSSRSLPRRLPSAPALSRSSNRAPVERGAKLKGRGAEAEQHRARDRPYLLKSQRRRL